MQEPTSPGARNDTLIDEPPAQGLAAELKLLEVQANGMPLSIGSIVDSLSERGSAVAIVLLAAPFIVLPVPGVSTAFGVVMLALSLGVLFGRKPHLPAFVRRRQLSPGLLSSIVRGTTWVLGKFQRFVRPRMAWVTDRRMHALIGVSLVLCTILFALPIPIPLNNAPPAVGLVLLSLGLAERDGLLTLIGHVYTLLMWAVLLICVALFWSALKTHVFSKWNGGGAATSPAMAMFF